MRSSLANRYAHALHSAALETGSATIIEKDVNLLWDWMDSSTETEALINRVSRYPQACGSIVDYLKVKLDLDPMTGKLLAILGSRKKLYLLKNICEEYISKIKYSRGIIPATVVSARKLDETERKKIQDRLDTQTGKTVDITWNLDPSILGGLQIKIRDLVLDGSLRTRLKHLEEHLLGSK